MYHIEIELKIHLTLRTFKKIEYFNIELKNKKRHDEKIKNIRKITEFS